MKGEFVMTKANKNNHSTEIKMNMGEKIKKYFQDNALYFLSASCVMNGSYYTFFKYFSEPARI